MAFETMTLDEQGKAAAEEFRALHNLGSQPLHDLVLVIEQATAHEVAVLDVEDANEHGLTMLDAERKIAFIGVARTRHPIPHPITLAPELTHVLVKVW